MHTVFTLKDSLDSTDADNPDINRQIVNMARLMSSANRKNMPMVDIKGNAQLYTVGIKARGLDIEVVAKHAPNTYVTRRAVKAWHDARRKMFKRLGMNLNDLKPYGATLRPYLSNPHRAWEDSHASVDSRTVHLQTHIPEVATLDAIQSEYGAVTPKATGEWTYSSAAVSVPMEEKEGSSGQMVGAYDLVDTYKWHLLGSSVTEPDSGSTEGYDESGPSSDQDSYLSVGIIESWLDSFKTKLGNVYDESTDVVEDNPLLELIADSASSGEAIEIAQDIQKENPPWDRTDAIYIDGFTRTIRSTQDNEGYMIVEAPCGLLELTLTGNNTDGDHTAEVVEVELEVLDIRDM